MNDAAIDHQANVSASRFSFPHLSQVVPSQARLAAGAGKLQPTGQAAGQLQPAGLAAAAAGLAAEAGAHAGRRELPPRGTVPSFTC